MCNDELKFPPSLPTMFEADLFVHFVGVSPLSTLNALFASIQFNPQSSLSDQFVIQMCPFDLAPDYLNFQCDPLIVLFAHSNLIFSYLLIKAKPLTLNFL